MMRNLLLLAALIPFVATAQAEPTTGTRSKLKPAKCERHGARQVAGAPKAGVRKLGELPPAERIYTVLREVDGCPTPVSVRGR